MKKKLLASVSAIFIVAMLSGGVFAETSFQALLTDIKLYLNGKKVDKEVVVINGSSYLPVRAISEALGLNVDWKGEEKSIYISSASSNSSGNEAVLKELADQLQAKNTQLEEEIKKLKTTNQSNNSRNVVSEMTSGYQMLTMDFNAGLLTSICSSKWNDGKTFMVKGQEYSDNVVGIKFEDFKINLGKKFTLPYMRIKNEGLKYSKLRFKVAIDDRGKSFYSDVNFKSRISFYGKSNTLGDKWLLDVPYIIKREQDFQVVELDFKGYEFINIYIVPSTNGVTSNAFATPDGNAFEWIVPYNNIDFYKDYILIKDMEVK